MIKNLIGYLEYYFLDNEKYKFTTKPIRTSSTIHSENTYEEWTDEQGRKLKLIWKTN